MCLISREVEGVVDVWGRSRRTGDCREGDMTLSLQADFFDAAPGKSKGEVCDFSPLSGSAPSHTAMSTWSPKSQHIQLVLGTHYYVNSILWGLRSCPETKR